MSVQGTETSRYEMVQHDLNEIKLWGRGGQGTQLAAQMLAVAYFRSGKFVQAFATFGGERRGAPVQAQVRFSSAPIRRRCEVRAPHAAICFDAGLVPRGWAPPVAPGGLVLINARSAAPLDLAPGDYRVAVVDATGIGRTHGLGFILNSALMGAFARVTGHLSFELIREVVAELSPGRAEVNVAACRDGYNHVRWEDTHP